MAREVEALYTNGPAGGGGATISVRPILAMRSTLIPRHLVTPRVDLLEETPGTPLEHADGSSVAVFAQAYGPFHTYRREVRVADSVCTETITYRLSVPWFTWLFSWPVRRTLRNRPADGASTGWWAPPDRLSERQVNLLGLLAVATMVATFANTLFTQTATFAADSFGVDSNGIGQGGAVVRLGVLITLPFAFVADRVGAGYGYAREQAAELGVTRDQQRFRL